jgi:FkbM family methyltransferase
MGSRIERVVRGLIGKVGLELIPSWRLARLPLATHLRRLFDVLDVHCVLDVGANAGQYRDFLRREVRYAGPIVSFEPVRDLFERLSDRVREDRDWHAMNLALGDRSESAEIHVMAASEFSSLHSPKAEGPQYRMNVVRRTETVAIRRLDELWEDLRPVVPLDRVYLKTDTQGHDLAVIEGAETVLDRVVALQAEAAVVPVYDRVPGYCQFLAALEAKGYALSGMFPVASDDALRLLEFDCVMVRQ